MTILRVEGMHCNKCVERIQKALDGEEIKHTISLADKTVTIDGCDDCVKKAVDELEDLGFEATIS